MDWERHLLIGFISQKVARIVSDFFNEASKKRYDFIIDKINETLKPKESALLFIREGHTIQFPGDIEVFTISPPALDDIYRWLRERSAAEDRMEEEKAEEPAGEPEQTPDDGGEAGE